MADMITPDPSFTELPEFSPGRFRLLPQPEVDSRSTITCAWDHQLERLVACKYSMDPAVFGIMSRDELDEMFGPEGYTRSMLTNAAQEGRRYNLLREARLLATVDHPNVIPVLEVGRFRERVVALLLPYLDGGTAAVRDFSGPWESVLDTAMQIGRGVAALHQAGILHRDLKPSNILFDGCGWPRVADLGLSCRLTDTSAMNERVGTVAYMPPGVLEQGFKDVRDDLYAYCMIVFEMFYGRPPFDSAAERDRGRVAKVRRAGGVPRELHAILLRGLAPEPDHRWPNMPTLLERMERVRRRTSRRRPWAAATVAAGLAASMAIGVFASARPVQADECEDASRELASIWNDQIATELRGVFGTRKAGDGLQAWASRWAAVRARECDEARTNDLDTEVTPCTVMVRDRFQATVQAFRTPHLRSGLSYATVIADLPAPEHCLEHPEDTEWGHGGLLELRDIDIEVEALAKLGDLEAASARQAEYMDLALELQSDYGVARAIYFRGEIHRLQGSLEAATADFERAHAKAWELRVAVFVGEVQLKLAAVAGARGDLGAMDAHALGARDVFAATWPERVAEVLQVQGLALVTGPEGAQARGIELLRRAVEMREEQLREYGGTRELLSQAHESYARGLLAVKRAGEAIEYLDRALRVHQDEFGHGNWRTRGILKTKFLALLELRRFDDAVSVRRAILKVDEDAEHWRRYIEDVWWVAQIYKGMGQLSAAATVLDSGRDMVVRQGLEAEAIQFERAIEDLTRRSR
jgi:tetratricopeptide (TPR) repeat protein